MASADLHSSAAYDAATRTPDDYLFSRRFFARLTIETAAELARSGRLPVALAEGSITRWVFDTVEALGTYQCSEAFKTRGARTVCIEINGKMYRLSFAKICLIRDVHNQIRLLNQVLRLLDRVESASLLSGQLLADFKACRFGETIAGFHVSRSAVWDLSCIVDEDWLTDDVVNLRLEQMYYMCAAETPGEDPAALLLPVQFFVDARTQHTAGDSQYPAEITALRRRLASGSVESLGFISWTDSHYSATCKSLEESFNFGDSLHRDPPSDMLPILRWVFAGLEYFAPRPGQTRIATGTIDRQSSKHGHGSCGPAALNYIEMSLGLQGSKRWKANKATAFRNSLLQHLLVYHLVAKKKTSKYFEWVEPCSSDKHQDTVPPDAEIGTGWNDFNVHRLRKNSDHPIFAWFDAMESQPTISGTSTVHHPTVPSAPLAAPPLHQLETMSLDSPIVLESAFELKKADVIDIPDSPKIPSRIDPIIDLTADSPLKPAPVKREVIEILDSSPIRPTTPPRGMKRGTKDAPFLLLTPPSAGRVKKQPRATIGKSNVPQPRVLSLASGPLRVGKVFNTFQVAISRGYSSRLLPDPAVQRLRRRGGDALGRVDPTNWRNGKSGRTGCNARDIISEEFLGGSWRITVIEDEHNHAPSIPEGGHARRAPTAAHQALVANFAQSQSFGRRQMQAVLDHQFPGNKLEPRQISNMTSKHRREAKLAIQELGGDFAAISARLEELREDDPDWHASFQYDASNTASRLRHPGVVERLSGPIVKDMREFAGGFAFQTTYRQMELAAVYKAEALQLPDGMREWSDYAVARDHVELGWEWEGDESTVSFQ
ncbi:hypothetical protein HMN09_01177200 [Mycena chlorophos]|uniref:FAR1 domain-containing protein n=1 Tax=Mycena chlorophos TaxID=658473 RepID=A0A8H6VZG7_MYCCL|nr:hypothetical protein HMN09_01177200 [Mycena chlorophos]